MNEVTSSGAVAAGTKGLWAAVGVLGVAVVGLGGTLYATQRAPLPEVSIVPPVAVVAEAAAPAAPPAPVAAAPAAVVKPRPAAVKKPVPVAAAPTAITTPAPVPVPVVTVPPPVCVDCATVSAVTPIEREVATGGTGALAGGVLGAIVGNQIGRGSGRDAATIIGAIGGGIAGNQVEKKMKKVLAYQVELRMDDGQRHTLELDTPLTVGARVRYEGGNLQPLQAGQQG